MEQKKKIQTMLGLLLTIVFLAACSAPPPIPPLESPITETPASQPSPTAPAVESPAAPEEAAPLAEQGLCANTYYPVRQGATWSYKSTGGPAGEYTFTDTMTAVRADGFTLSTQIGELTRAQAWRCTPEGLVALQLGGAPAAMLSAQGIQISLDSVNSSGVMFPAQINAGDRWQHNMDFTGDVSVASEQATATGDAQMSFTAIGSESVTVPAGTFEALKIQIDTTLNIQANYEGLTLPVTLTGSHTYWFVPGVGWVRATGTGRVLNTSFSEATELQSYNIP